MLLLSSWCSPAAQEEPGDIEVVLNGGEARIWLPAGWAKDTGEEGLEGTTLFMRKDPLGVIAIDVSPLVGISPLICNSKTYQYDYLEAIKKSARGATGFFEDNTTFCGVPALIYNYYSRDKETKFKDIHFLKDCTHYIITFGCETGRFYEYWKDFARRVNRMEFAQ